MGKDPQKVRAEKLEQIDQAIEEVDWKAFLLASAKINCHFDA